MATTIDISKLTDEYRSGTLSGTQLKELEVSGAISKSERRKIVKKALDVTRKEKGADAEGVNKTAAAPEVDSKETKEKKNKDKKDKKDKSGDKKSKVTDKGAKGTTQPRAASASSGEVKAAETAVVQNKGTKFMVGVTCLNCRQEGHVLKYCPNVAKAVAPTGSGSGSTVCFNCGSTEHALKDCRAPRDASKLKFATCFVCKQPGHISRDCPENPNGLYPKGGCCHICLLKTHFSRDCPQKRVAKRKDAPSSVGGGAVMKITGSGDDVTGAFEEWDGKVEEPALEEAKKKKPKNKGHFYK